MERVNPPTMRIGNVRLDPINSSVAVAGSTARDLALDPL